MRLFSLLSLIFLLFFSCSEPLTESDALQGDDTSLVEEGIVLDYEEFELTIDSSDDMFNAFVLTQDTIATVFWDVPLVKEVIDNPGNYNFFRGMVEITQGKEVVALDTTAHRNETFVLGYGEYNVRIFYVFNKNDTTPNDTIFGEYHPFKVSPETTQLKLDRTIGRVVYLHRPLRIFVLDQLDDSLQYDIELYWAEKDSDTWQELDYQHFVPGTERNIKVCAAHITYKDWYSEERDTLFSNTIHVTLPEKPVHLEYLDTFTTFVRCSIPDEIYDAFVYSLEGECFIEYSSDSGKSWDSVYNFSSRNKRLEVPVLKSGDNLIRLTCNSDTIGSYFSTDTIYHTPFSIKTKWYGTVYARNYDLFTNVSGVLGIDYYGKNSNGEWEILPYSYEDFKTYTTQYDTYKPPYGQWEIYGILYTEDGGVYTSDTISCNSQFVKSIYEEEYTLNDSIAEVSFLASNYDSNTIEIVVYKSTDNSNFTPMDTLIPATESDPQNKTQFPVTFLDTLHSKGTYYYGFAYLETPNPDKYRPLFQGKTHLSEMDSLITVVYE